MGKPRTKNRAILATERSETTEGTESTEATVKVRIGRQNVQMGHEFFEAGSEQSVTAAQAKRLGTLATTIS